MVPELIECMGRDFVYMNSHYWWPEKGFAAHVSYLGKNGEKPDHSDFRVDSIKLFLTAQDLMPQDDSTSEGFPIRAFQGQFMCEDVSIDTSSAPSELVAKLSHWPWDDVGGMDGVSSSRGIAHFPCWSTARSVHQETGASPVNSLYLAKRPPMLGDSDPINHIIVFLRGAPEGEGKDSYEIKRHGAALFMPWMWPDAIFTRAVLTRTTLSIHRGILLRRREHLSVRQMESLVVEQGLLGRVFNFGTLKVEGQDGQIRISVVRDPSGLGRYLERLRLGHHPVA